jgi:hypothetical protein
MSLIHYCKNIDMCAVYKPNCREYYSLQFGLYTTRMSTFLVKPPPVSKLLDNDGEDERMNVGDNDSDDRAEEDGVSTHES